MKLIILIIDDEEVFREETAEMIRERGHICLTAENGKKGLELALEKQPDLVLCDLIMPIMNGIDVLKNLSTSLPETKSVMITAHGTLDTAIEALREGASDYILKPVNFQSLILKIHQISERKELIHEIKNLRREISQDTPEFELIGKGKEINKIYHLIETVSETKTTVLIRGETGTGKELAARAIHNRSSPPGKPYVTVNCAAIPDALLESELFGYEQGAFTGANQAKSGHLEKANGGTIFLDEIGEMPLSLQSKILRAIEQKAIQRVGSVNPIKIDTRFIAATNRNLQKMVEEGSFREDLYYRICVLELYLPPLRERRDDIPLLAEHFVHRFNLEMKREVQGIENSAMQALILYHWPGNIRELKNAVERAMLFQKNGFLKREHFPKELQEVETQESVPDNLEQACKTYERAHIRNVLQKVDGSRTKAAQLLGIDRSTLYRKIQE